MPTRSLADDVTAKPGANAATRAAAGVAIVVYLGTAGLLVLAAWLLTGHRTALAWVLAAALVAFAVLIRPRLGRGHPDTTPVSRPAAPATYAVVDAVTARLGGRKVWRIAVSAEFTASYRVVGFRRRVVLTVGYPLWNLLDPDERVALLAHEQAHGVNGDTSRGTLIAPSLNALVEGLHTLRGRGEVSGPRVLGALVSSPLLGLLRLQEKLLLAASQRAEFYADHLAATVAGADAQVSLLRKLHLAEPAMRALRTGITRGDTDIWADSRAWLTDLGPVVVEDGESTDSTHPPTDRRVAALLGRAYGPAAVVSTVEDARRADHELAPAARDVVSALRRE
ncbi:Zn-dependent protease with chaperone function [Actinokineospora baliensis]|uniref:M48 family metalloprotease n=1 Tax=Actinokineospora baliensis TaxID=547056 RepID=UPI0019563B4D|nr:M48 family metallopeptidase [Actinokineospora baliensis]MBM7772166.1 Zn-dependent protease with chaperone function [Actinokineospora baliensis]